MRKSEKPTLFLLDNNVFIAAIKNPHRETGSLKLVLEILKNSRIHLVGNTYLLEEMARYAEVFKSQTAILLLEALVSKTRLIEIEERNIKICKQFIGTADPVDVVNAATCLQTDAVLISNDKHFNRIRDEGIINVWSITTAINKHAYR